MKIGILGGGISGLSLANFLNKDYEVLEAEKECGGLAMSYSEEGFTFDISGGHIIFSKDKEILDFMLLVLGDNIVKNRRNTKILFKERFVKYPFENGLADLPKEDNYECLINYINNPYKEKPTNFKEWIYHTFGKGIAERYMIPYNEKIWKYPAEKMSLHWVERIPKPPMEDVVKSSLGIETEGYTHQLYFYYPKFGGVKSLVLGLEKRAKKVTKDFRIISIEKKNGKWHVANGSEVKVFDKIVSTLPLNELFLCLKDVPKEVLECVKNLKYNSLIEGCIGLNKPQSSDITWLYVPEKDVLFNRIVYLTNYSLHTAPQGKSCMIAEVTFNEGDEISKKSDEELSKEIINGLHGKKLIDKKDVCYFKLFRTKYAYIVYDINYNKNLKKIKDYLDEIGIRICGRFAEYDYINMDQCIMRAKNLAIELNENE